MSLDLSGRWTSRNEELPIVSRQEREDCAPATAREERDLTRARDALAAERRRMPWVAVEKEPGGRREGR